MENRLCVAVLRVRQTGRGDRHVLPCRSQDALSDDIACKAGSKPESLGSMDALSSQSMHARSRSVASMPLRVAREQANSAGAACSAWRCMRMSASGFLSLLSIQRTLAPRRRVGEIQRMQRSHVRDPERDARLAEDSSASMRRDHESSSMPACVSTSRADAYSRTPMFLRRTMLGFAAVFICSTSASSV